MATVALTAAEGGKPLAAAVKTKRGRPKNAIRLFVDGSGGKKLVLLSASVERIGVSRMRDFWNTYALFKMRVRLKLKLKVFTKKNRSFLRRWN